MISLTLALLSSYLVGAIPFSFLAGKLCGGIDLRKVGSGNLGATNTFRALGGRVALVVLILDMLKGWMAPFWFARVSVDAPVLPFSIVATLCGIAAILGHLFPLYLGFNGGKGIATSTGVFLSLEPRAFLASFIVFWSAFAASGGIVSLGSLLASLTLPIAMFVVGAMRDDLDWTRLALATALVIVLWLRHRSNIVRLLHHNEKSVFDRKRATTLPRNQP